MTNSTTIMVIDDDADIRELMKMFLEADGYDVSLAKDGLDAIEQLQAGARPALILLDLMLPRMDGEQFLKRMRAGRFGKIPVVVISGHNAAQQKAVEIQAVSCLEKPVELDELLKTVRQFASAA